MAFVRIFFYAMFLVLLNVAINVIIQRMWSNPTNNTSTQKISKTDRILYLEALLNESRSRYNDIQSIISLPTSSDKLLYHNHHQSALPMFTSDGGDMIFGSIIETSFDSFGPHITTFFLSHYNLIAYESYRLGVRLVDPMMQAKWKAAAKLYHERELAGDITYEMSGKRISLYDYTCIISHSAGEKSYTVKGYFLPNRLSTDYFSNRRYDVLRCPMLDGRNASETLRYSDHEVQVEIIWNSVSLAKFTVPWKTRRTGYLLSSPTLASQQDVWTNTASYMNRSSTWHPIVHLSMPLTRLQPSAQHYALMLEYVSHHLLLGFDHIYFTVTMSWDSDAMQQLLHIFHSYIMQGKLSIFTSTDHRDCSNPTVLGLEWDHTAIKIFSSTMTLYTAKGLADYLAVFDVDEFFIPKLKYTSIQEIIRAVDMPAHRNHVIPGNGVMGSRGFADKHKHPLCFLLVLSEIVGKFRPTSSKQIWIGKRFAHAQEHIVHGAVYDPYGAKPLPFTYSKVIYPTRRVYQAGVGSGSCCRLDWKWTICGNNSEQEVEFCEKGYGIPDRVCDLHRFDEVVGKKKLKTLDPMNIGIILHFMVYHDQKNALASKEALAGKNSYAMQFFPAVMRDLEQRGLDFLLVDNKEASRPRDRSMDELQGE